MSSIAIDIARALSPAEFCRSMGFDPDPWQAQVLESRHPRILLNAARQTGKSWVCAVKAVHTAVYEPGALVLVVAPSLRQSQELFLKIRTVARAMDGGAPPADGDSASVWTLSNGSRVACLPGSEQTIRAFSSVRLLLLDEASRTEDATVAACRPFLAVSAGQMIALSTPAGCRGWWYEAWESGGNDYERIRVQAKDCPRITPEFLRAELAALGPHMFAAEYECSFVSGAFALFDEADLKAMFTTDFAPLFPNGV